MALSLIVYPAEGYNSFVTLVEANDLIEASLNNAQWEALTDDDKMRYLMIAFTSIKNLDNIELPSTSEECLQEAQASMAIHDLVNGISSTAQSEAPIASASVGSISVTYATRSPEYVSKYPPDAIPCLESYGALISSGSVRLYRA